MITPISCEKFIHPLSLHEAFESENLALALDLIRSGADLNALNDKGLAPIHLAATRPSLNAIRLLKETGANLSITTPLGENALHFVSIQKNSRIATMAAIDCLLAHGVSMSIQDNQGDLPFHKAAGYGNIPAMERFLFHGASIEDKSPLVGHTALCSAALHNHVDVIKWLLEQGASKSVYVNGLTPYIIALAWNSKASAALIGSDPLSETILAFKKIAHAAALKGEILAEQHRFSVEAFPNSHLFFQEWAFILRRAFLPTSVIKAFTEAANICLSSSSDEIAYKIHRKALVIFNFRSVNHAYSIVFSKNRMFIGDGGGGFGPVISVFKFDSSKITSDMIDVLKNLYTKSNEEVQHAIASFFPLLSAVRDEVFEKKLTYQKQKVGNCAYASSKIALRIALSCLGIRNYKQRSKEMSDSLSETVLVFKKIAHAAALKGQILAQEHRFSVENFPNSTLFFREWALILKQSSFPTSLIKAFTEAADICLSSSSSDEIAYKIHRKALVIFNFISLNHAYSIVFSKNRMFIGDGSGDFGPVIKVFKINSSKVTSGMIDVLKKIYWKTNREVQHAIASFFPLLSAVRDEVFEKKLICQKQKVSNCTYASSKIALRIALACLGVRNYKQRSKEMSISFLKKTLDDWEVLKLHHRLKETPSMIALLEAARAKLHKKESKLPEKKCCVIS